MNKLRASVAEDSPPVSSEQVLKAAVYELSWNIAAVAERRTGRVCDCVIGSV
jgi:hypothetical protein